MERTTASSDGFLRFPVYLSKSLIRGKLGVEITIAERRLVKQSDHDRIIALILAPRGSRVRTRRDQHGHDQLMIPRGQSIWSRLFGPRVIVPAKYLIGDARRRNFGLALIKKPAEESQEVRK